MSLELTYRKFKRSPLTKVRGFFCPRNSESVVQDDFVRPTPIFVLQRSVNIPPAHVPDVPLVPEVPDVPEEPVFPDHPK